LRQRSFSHPHPLADADTLSCKLAKASLRGEGQDEGVLILSNQSQHPSPLEEKSDGAQDGIGFGAARLVILHVLIRCFQNELR
jgi:hypothetical protein